MIRSPFIRTLSMMVALGTTLALAGCNTDGIVAANDKANRPLSPKMLQEIESKNMDKDSPILVRVFKEEAELEVWKQDRTGHFALLKTYPICRWSGELGPKIKEGDRQAPEGFYTITPGQMNPRSAYYLSFDLGYPNAFDRAHGRTGSQLMVHGDCSSRGCYSMTDEQIAEIYALGRDAFFGGQKSFQVQAYPFRMTAQNLAKHRNNPNMAFWKMLKVGNDHFEVTKLEPKVNVCEKHYVFDAESSNGRPLSFNASGKCPAFQVPEEIATAVKAKEHQDEVQVAELVRRGTPTVPVRTNADGGMNKVFIAAVKNNQVGVAPQDTPFASTPPGTIPPTVRPPRIPELADAPVVAGAAPAPHPDAGIAGQSPQMAIADTSTSPAPAESSGTKSKGFFASLFSSKESESTDKKSDGALDRLTRLVGLRKDEKKVGTATPPAPKPKPAAKATHVASHSAVQAKPVAEPAKPAVHVEPAKATVQAWPETKPQARPQAEPKAEPAPAPAAVTASATPPRAQAVPTGTAMTGAVPVVPAGTFDSRWSAFR